MDLPAIDQEYLRQTLIELLNTPSPTGRTEAAIAVVERHLGDLGLDARRNAKGALISTWEGASQDAPRALTAHVDTLGAMVKEIKPSGRLKLSKVGGFAWNTVEGEGLTVFTASGEAVRGALLVNKASAHVYSKKVGETERKDETMEARLDIRSSSAEETRAQGIEVGDFVAFDPRVEAGKAGFIRSRHLDDKAGVACLLAAVQAMTGARLKPSQRTTLHFSNFEEVGHGAAAGFPADLRDLVAVDMAVVGEGQASDEFHVTVCAKDSSGPYHEVLTRELRALAEKHQIPYRVDIYPFYGSDAEAYWRAGGDVRIALIGPGVDASHNYERTHLEALTATARLISAYLTA